MAIKYIDNKYDVIIIGGGPAGSMTAMNLSENGYHDSLLKRSSNPETAG